MNVQVLDPGGLRKKGEFIARKDEFLQGGTDNKQVYLKEQERTNVMTVVNAIRRKHATKKEVRTTARRVLWL
jgi:hypothetical protein